MSEQFNQKETQLNHEAQAQQKLTLKYGTSVETIGHSSDYSGAKRKPSQLLQETKSAIDAAVRLQEAIGATQGHEG
jgi:hypothetical protein